jgi:formylglycine-generating enzyme
MQFVFLSDKRQHSDFKTMRSALIISVILFFHPLKVMAQMKETPTVGPVYEMVFIEGGEFLMGDLFYRHNPDALPVHEVHLDDYYIGKYPVTFDEYDMFASLYGFPLPDDGSIGRGSMAVVDVTWDEALAFCSYLGFRLPTEQEWEFAARSGGKPEMFSGTNVRDSLHHFAHYSYNSPPSSRPVGTKKPNGLGIYDMSGNVFEWIGNWYMQYQTNPERRNNFPLDKNDFRVIRGGSAMQLPFTIRTYWRVYTFRDNRSREIGFRCAASASS